MVTKHPLREWYYENLIIINANAFITETSWCVRILEAIFSLVEFWLNIVHLPTNKNNVKDNQLYKILVVEDNPGNFVLVWRYISHYFAYFEITSIGSFKEF
jgi:hypothetical protein